MRVHLAEVVGYIEEPGCDENEETGDLPLSLRRPITAGSENNSRSLVVLITGLIVFATSSLRAVPADAHFVTYLER